MDDQSCQSQSSYVLTARQNKFGRRDIIARIASSSYEKVNPQLERGTHPWKSRSQPISLRWLTSTPKFCISFVTLVLLILSSINSCRSRQFRGRQPAAIAKSTNQQTYCACGKLFCCTFLKEETSKQRERNKMTIYQHQEKCTSLPNAVLFLPYQHILTLQSCWTRREQSTWKES